MGGIATVQIGHPGPSDADGHDYWRSGAGAQLSSMYGSLLGMQPIYIGYHKLVDEDGRLPEIGFEHAPGDPPPQWPDPDHPQQVHLDIEVGDLEDAARLVLSHGAGELAGGEQFRVFADPVGHPFCLYRATQGTDGLAPPGRIVRIVFDCFSPRSLASFYEELLDMRSRVLDTPERVEIRGDSSTVALAFQHSPSQAPRWPDPSHPAQLHLDLVFEDGTARELAEALGAVHRPLPERPDNLVYADPAGHPFCLGLEGYGTPGPAQVAEYEAWLAAHPEQKA